MKNYVVLDFEMCKVPKGARCSEYHKANEIIQIGAVLLDEEYKMIGEFNKYIKPKYGKLDSFISSFTGIKWDALSEASSLEEVLKEFSEWIPESEVWMVAWSDSDQNQLYGEMTAKNVHNQRLEELSDFWIDSQKIYSEKVDNSRNYSLSEALVACDIDTKGRAHDGLSDAYNTGLLFAKLMTETELKLNSFYMEAKKEETSHLSCSLGDLLAGFNFGESGSDK